MLSASKKKLLLVYRKIFLLVDPVQHQYVFSKGREWGEYKCLWVGVMGSKAWGEGAEKIGRLTASLCLVFKALVAPATATPDWCKGQ